MKKTETIQDNKELFTGGEWEVRKNMSDYRPTIVMAGIEKICVADRIKANGEYDKKQQEANAALIAQAPAMYFIIDDLLAEMEFLNLDIPDMKKAREILNKANPKQ